MYKGLIKPQHCKVDTSFKSEASFSNGAPSAALPPTSFHIHHGSEFLLLCPEVSPSLTPPQNTLMLKSLHRCVEVSHYKHEKCGSSYW